MDFARRNGVTRIFLAKPAKRPIPFLAKKNIVMEVVRLPKDRQVTVVPLADSRINLAHCPTSYTVRRISLEVPPAAGM